KEPSAVYSTGIDCRGFHHGTLGCDVAGQESNRAGDSLCLGLRRRENYFIRIHSIELLQMFTQSLTTLRGGPLIKDFLQRFACSSQHRRIQQTKTTKMQHYLWYAPRQKYSHRGMVDGTVGKHTHQPGSRAI